MPRSSAAGYFTIQILKCNKMKPKNRLTSIQFDTMISSISSVYIIKIHEADGGIYIWTTKIYYLAASFSVTSPFSLLCLFFFPFICVQKRRPPAGSVLNKKHRTGCSTLPGISPASTFTGLLPLSMGG
jgi:hypothetical protein